MATTTTTTSCHLLCRSSTCPPWLQAALAEIEQRVRAVALSPSEEVESDSFAERAESYYLKRPQLLSLVQDLHNRYLYLADRYSQTLKPHKHHRQISTVESDIEYDDQATDAELPDSVSSDAESSLSFQLPPPLNAGDGGVVALDLIVAELVMVAVERELVVDDIGEAERRRSESERKIDLQRSLLEVLESERIVLLGENARLGFRAAAAEEDRRGMAAEVGYMRRKAAELARIVVKLGEDHRVCLLGRKIEGLQAQIYGLERRNRECYEAMARREKEKGEVRFELDRLRNENRRLKEEVGRKASKRKENAKWWGRLRRMGWTQCPCVPDVKASKGCFYS